MAQTKQNAYYELSQYESKNVSVMGTFCGFSTRLNQENKLDNVLILSPVLINDILIDHLHVKISTNIQSICNVDCIYYGAVVTYSAMLLKYDIDKHSAEEAIYNFQVKNCHVANIVFNQMVESMLKKTIKNSNPYDKCSIRKISNVNIKYTKNTIYAN